MNTTDNMFLNDTLVDIAKNKLTKLEKIKLHDMTKLPMSAVYKACLGKRKLEEKDYDIFQKYIVDKTKPAPKCVGD